MATVASCIDSPFTVAGQHRIRTDFPFKQMTNHLHQYIYYFFINDIARLAEEIYVRNLSKKSKNKYYEYSSTIST